MISIFVVNLKDDPIIPRAIKKSDRSVKNIKKISRSDEPGISNIKLVVKVNKIISEKISQNVTVIIPSIPKITEYSAWYPSKHLKLHIFGYFFQTSGFPQVLQFMDVFSAEFKDFHQFFN